MNTRITEENLKEIDRRALIGRIAGVFEVYHPNTCLTGIHAIAYVTNLPIWKVRRCIEGTWQLSFYHWQKIEKALGKPMWDCFMKELFLKRRANEL